MLAAVGLAAVPGISGAVETAAYGAHLAWCLGLAEETAPTSTVAGNLAPALQARIGELELDPAFVEPAAEAGRQAARAHVVSRQERRLLDALTGCRTSLATGIR